MASLVLEDMFWWNGGEELSQNKEMTVRVFGKCGISIAADGSEDFDIHIEGLSEYSVQMDDVDLGAPSVMMDHSLKVKVTPKNEDYN